MTLKEFLEKVDLQEDINKTVIWTGKIGWDDVDVEVGKKYIKLVIPKNNRKGR